MKQSENKKKSIVGILLLGSIVLIWVAAGVIAVMYFAPLENAIEFDDLKVHLDSLQDIANELGGGSRSVSTGYNASCDYVVKMLEKYGEYLTVSRQYFNILEWEMGDAPELVQNVPVSRVYKFGTDFDIFTYSTEAHVVGAVADVGEGCVDSDYDSFPKNGSFIALALRGDCTFVEKNEMAEKYGAKALIIYNNVNGVFTSRASTNTKIPVFGLDPSLASEMKVATQVELKSHGKSFNTTTLNVLAETKKGDDTRTIVVGSHLDSVPAGPGINDNGSGSSGNLAMAIHMARKNFNNKYKIRFAWWGAEEVGLLGSRHYVTDLVNNNREEYLRIALNLNFDMIGSPNFQRGIYNATSGDEVRADIVAGSLIIQKKFEEYFNMHKIEYTLVPFNGRSDYGPFIEEGIPACGLASGAEGIKTEAGRIQFGGLANAQFDPCYHQYCDTINNVDEEVIVQNTNAALVVLKQLATDKELIDSVYNSNDRGKNVEVNKFTDK